MRYSEGNSTPIYIEPLKENIEQIDVEVDASRTEEVYGKASVLFTGIENTWAKVYLDNVFEGEEPIERTEWQLIYVDNNCIPELWMNHEQELTGKIYTLNENRIDKVEFEYGVPHWREKQNFLLISGPDSIQSCEIQDGRFRILEEGKSSGLMSENTNTYYWNGVEVTEEEYSQNYDLLCRNEDYTDRYQNVYTYKQLKLLLQALSN